MNTRSPEASYSPEVLRDFLLRHARRLGAGLAEQALCLHYAARRPQTPAWARTTIYAALAYLLLPADLVPDILPVTGYSDDLATLALALGTVSVHVTDEVRRQARDTADRWLGQVGG